MVHATNSTSPPPPKTFASQRPPQQPEVTPLSSVFSRALPTMPTFSAAEKARRKRREVSPRILTLKAIRAKLTAGTVPRA